MRRWCAVTQLLGWPQVEHNWRHMTEARIWQEVQEAMSSFGGRSPTKWVAVSQVSSLLSDQTREALADFGGLGSFCRRLQKTDKVRFDVKSVDGVLCVKLHDMNKALGTCCDLTNKRRELSALKRLRHICRYLPDRPVTLTACQRVWGLSSIDATLEHLESLMERVECSLNCCSKSSNMPMYVRIGYYGKQTLIVGCGSQLISKSSGRTSAEEEEEEENGKETPRWEVEDFSPEYDLWRFSRFLRTDGFVPISEVMQLTDGILQTSLLQVVMSYPERIALQLGPATRAEDVDTDRFYTNGASRGELHEVIGIKFLLSDEEVARHLTKNGSKLSDLTDEELQAERAKLKELPPLRRQKGRRAIVREEFRRRYPYGNVFLNPNVLALYTYDQMTPGVWINNSSVRDHILPEGGKGCMHVGVDFFDMFPHLFITQGITTTSVNVMRREQGMEGVSSDGESWKHSVFSDEEILLFLLPRLTNKKEEWGENKSLDVITTLLPRHVFKYLQSRGGAKVRLIAILKRYPEAFEVMERDAEGELGKELWKVHLHYDGIVRLGTQLVNTLQASKNNGGGNSREKRGRESGQL